MFCLKCGSELPEGTTECEDCGFKLPELPPELLNRLNPDINDPSAEEYEPDNPDLMRDVQPYFVGCEPLSAKPKKEVTLNSVPLRTPQDRQKKKRFGRRK